MVLQPLLVGVKYFRVLEEVLGGIMGLKGDLAEGDQRCIHRCPGNSVVLIGYIDPSLHGEEVFTRAG